MKIGKTIAEARAAFDTAFDKHFGEAARLDNIAAKGFWHGDIITINGVEHYRWGINPDQIQFLD